MIASCNLKGSFSGPESEVETERKVEKKAGNFHEKGGCPAKGSWAAGARRSWCPSGFGPFYLLTLTDHVSMRVLY